MPATASRLMVTMQGQVTRWRPVYRRFGMGADAVHALGVRQVFVARFAGNGKGRLPVELRNDRTELMQCACHVMGEFAGGQDSPATGRQFFMAMIE